MLVRILLLVAGLFITELVILLQLSESFGVIPTLVFILLSGILGMVVIRMQGLLTLFKARQALSAGRSPAGALSEGFLLLTAGVFLVLPGLLTDLCGLLLLIPQIRKQVAQRLQVNLRQQATSQFQRGFQTYTVYEYSQNSPTAAESASAPRFDAQGNEIIDVEFTKKSEHLPDK